MHAPADMLGEKSLSIRPAAAELAATAALLTRRILHPSGDAYDDGRFISYSASKTLCDWLCAFVADDAAPLPKDAFPAIWDAIVFQTKTAFSNSTLNDHAFCIDNVLSAIHLTIKHTRTWQRAFTEENTGSIPEYVVEFTDAGADAIMSLVEMNRELPPDDYPMLRLNMLHLLLDVVKHCRISAEQRSASAMQDRRINSALDILGSFKLPQAQMYKCLQAQRILEALEIMASAPFNLVSAINKSSLWSFLESQIEASHVDNDMGVNLTHHFINPTYNVVYQLSLLVYIRASTTALAVPTTQKLTHTPEALLGVFVDNDRMMSKLLLNHIMAWLSAPNDNELALRVFSVLNEPLLVVGSLVLPGPLNMLAHLICDVLGLSKTALLDLIVDSEVFVEYVLRITKLIVRLQYDISGVPPAFLPKSQSGRPYLPHIGSSIIHPQVARVLRDVGMELMVWARAGLLPFDPSALAGWMAQIKVGGTQPQL